MLESSSLLVGSTTSLVVAAVASTIARAFKILRSSAHSLEELGRTHVNLLVVTPTEVRGVASVLVRMRLIHIGVVVKVTVVNWLQHVAVRVGIDVVATTSASAPTSMIARGTTLMLVLILVVVITLFVVSLACASCVP